MKETLFVLAVLCATLTAVATEAPRHETIERVVPSATHAIVGLLTSCTVTNEPGNRVLAVTIVPSRTLWGGTLAEPVKAEYKEFVIPLVPEGMSVSFANYSGSGIEWNAKAMHEYICFLKREGETFTLLRLEPVANEKGILEVHVTREAAPSPRTEDGDPKPMPLSVSPQIAPGVFDITTQIAALLCEGISVSAATLDTRPTYCDGPSLITAKLICDAKGVYTVHFDHPRGTSQSPISLSVEPSPGFGRHAFLHETEQGFGAQTLPETLGGWLLVVLDASYAGSHSFAIVLDCNNPESTINLDRLGEPYRLGRTSLSVGSNRVLMV